MALLFLLAVGSFTVGVGAFAVIGVLTPLSADLALTPIQASWAMSAYAIAYAIGSPVLTSVSGTVDRRLVLALGMALFCLGCALTTFADNPSLFYVARIVAAFGSGLFSPGAAAVAVALAAPGERGRALSVVFGGIAMANVIGVPFGAYIGYVLGWRWVFGAVALAAVFMTMAILVRVPEKLPFAPARLADLGYTMIHPRLGLAVTLTATAMGAGWIPFTFLAPLIEEKTGGGATLVGVLLAVYGAGSFLGNIVGGWLADRFGPIVALRVVMASQIPFTITITLAPWGPWSGMALLLIWGLVGWAFMVPQQSRLVGLDPSRMQILLALNAACIYAGAAIGAMLAGLVKTAFGLWALGPAAALIILIAMAQLELSARMQRAGEP